MQVEFSPNLVCTCGIPCFAPTACSDDVHTNNEYVAGLGSKPYICDNRASSVGGKKGRGDLRHHPNR